MNIDKIQTCEEQIIVSIDKTKYLNDNTRLLKRWYPHQYQSMRLLDVIDKSGYINYIFASKEYDRLNVNSWSILDKLSYVYSLFNFEQLERDGFAVNFDDDNLFSDKNRIAVLLFIETLDLYALDEIAHTSFDIQLKARILSLFSQYKFQDIVDADFKLKFHTDFALEVLACKGISELKATVSHYIEEQRAALEHQYTHVSKKQFRNYKILILVFLVLWICSVVIIGYIETVQVEKLKLDNELYSLYLRSDYLGVIETSNGNDLNREQKQMVARSVVSSVDIEEEQKAEIADSITSEASESLVDYWIYIGYGQYLDASIEAKTIENDEYVLYALQLEEERLINDSQIDGLEKERFLTSVRADINMYEQRISGEGM